MDDPRVERLEAATKALVDERVPWLQARDLAGAALAAADLVSEDRAAKLEAALTQLLEAFTVDPMPVSMAHSDAFRAARAALAGLPGPEAS